MHPALVVLLILISPLLFLIWLIDKANEERMLRKAREEDEQKERFGKLRMSARRKRAERKMKDEKPNLQVQ